MKNETNTGIILNYILIVLTVISSIIVAPVLIGGMSNELYGIYTNVFSVLVLLIAADFGIGTVVIRNVVKYISRNDKESLENYMFWMFWVYVFFAGVIFVLCMTAFFLTPYLFNFSGDKMKMYKYMFLLMSLNCTALFIQNYLFSIITGYGKMIFTRACNIVKVVLRTVFFILIASYVTKPPLFSLLFLVDIILCVLIIFAFYIYIKKQNIKIKYHFFNKSLIFKNMRDMLYLYIMPLSENSYWMICSTVIILVMGSEWSAVFAISATFCQIFSQLATTLSYFKMPECSDIWFKRKNNDEFNSFVNESGKIQTAFLGLILVCFIAFGRTFLYIWMGNVWSAHDINLAFTIALLMLVSFFFPYSQSMLEIASYAQNKYLGRAVILVLSTAFNTIFLWFGLKTFGLIGAGYAVVASTIIFRFILMNIYFHRIGLGVKSYIYNINVKILPTLLITTGIGAGALIFMYDSMQVQIAAGIVSTMIYLILIYMLYLSDNQKNAIRNMVKRFLPLKGK